MLAGEPNDEDLELAAGIVARYADTSKDEVVRVHIWTDDGSSTECNVTPLRPRSVRELAI